MPDSGYPAYIPQLPADVVREGDLAAALAGYATTTYVDDSVAPLAADADVVHGPGWSISADYSIPLNDAVGNLTTFQQSVDVFEIADRGWSFWYVLGQFNLTDGVAQVGRVEFVAPVTVLFTFVSLAPGPQLVAGNFDLVALGH